MRASISVRSSGVMLRGRSKSCKKAILDGWPDSHISSREHLQHASAGLPYAVKAASVHILSCFQTYKPSCELNKTTLRPGARGLSRGSTPDTLVGSRAAYNGLPFCLSGLLPVQVPAGGVLGRGCGAFAHGTPPGVGALLTSSASTLYGYVALSTL